MARGHSAAAAQRGTAEAGWGSQTFHPNRTAARESPGKTGWEDAEQFGPTAFRDVTKGCFEELI